MPKIIVNSAVHVCNIISLSVFVFSVRKTSNICLLLQGTTSNGGGVASRIEERDHLLSGQVSFFQAGARVCQVYISTEYSNNRFHFHYLWEYRNQQPVPYIVILFVVK